ncbi:hypothetical protein D3C76_1258750 [compost metagenome]
MALQRIRQPQARGHILFQSIQQCRLRRITATAPHHLERLQQRHPGLEQGRQLPAEPRRVGLFPPLRQAELQPTGRPQAGDLDALADKPGPHIGRAAPGRLATDRRAVGVGAVPGVEECGLGHAKVLFLPVRQAWKQLAASMQGRASVMLTRVVQRR